MSYKSVTTAQMEQVRKMASEKGVSRESFQKGLDDGTMSRILDTLKEELPVAVGNSLCAPVGARIITIKVKVQLDQGWNVSINEAGPKTPENYNVRKVGGMYAPTGTGVVEEELILLNYQEGGGSWDKAIAWSQQNHLRRTDPRRVFAVGKDHPKFNYEVGPNPCYVVATEECTFDGGQQACYVWWSGSKRGARLDWVGSYGGAGDWFAFRK